MPYENEHKVNLKQVLNRHSDLKNIAIIIGPEGGFSDDEVTLLNHSKVEKVTLGPRILRTETAGIAVLAMLSYEIEFER